MTTTDASQPERPTATTLAVKFGEDRRVTALLGPLLVIVFATLVIVNLLILIWPFYEEIMLRHAPSPEVKGLVNLFAIFRGGTTIYGGPIVQLLPGLIAVLCFAKNQRILSRLGVAVLVLDIALLVISGVALSVSAPSDLDRIFYGETAAFNQFRDIARPALALAGRRSACSPDCLLCLSPQARRPPHRRKLPTHLR